MGLKGIHLALVVAMLTSATSSAETLRYFGTARSVDGTQSKLEFSGQAEEGAFSGTLKYNGELVYVVGTPQSEGVFVGSLLLKDGRKVGDFTASRSREGVSIRYRTADGKSSSFTIPAAAH